MRVGSRWLVHYCSWPLKSKTVQNQELSELTMTKQLRNELDSTKAQRTRAMLLASYNELVLQGRQDKIRVPDVIRKADVGRSTFYDHYSSIDGIQREALSHPLGRLADVLVGSSDQAELRGLLDHFWEYRPQARSTLADVKTRDAVMQVLYEALVERLPAVERSLATELQTRQLAESTMALVRVWISGEIDCSIDALSDCIVSTAKLFLQGLDVRSESASDERVTG